MAGFVTGYSWEVAVAGARSLRSSDVAGGSDPYAVLYWSTGEEERTAVTHRTSDPVWDAVFATPERQNFVMVEVWDKDTLTADDFLGSVKIALSNADDDVRDVWEPLLGRDNEPTGGDIHLRITKVPIYA
ncbi:uncharacterized protein AMSG_00783 [Thecamonas trahens ATCC 50062]|uniref:C2 domain-containing protein n=1 Tax=Thecamonas trahens ATCC 50062 TaxID=461836 RepID=A0A0L0DE75_THETB|nr:hypothetical protein AMSG_00783 [Thecamonas trahens ATCC 50062]KNC50622.1 hypothetical protein AMSG_00783 [Thecamonas trahens ATCC 50062]|eukprot:XP_013762509.1 hypothetical protein AMSG_00783 [Thecamonas trahens ATCC 50062]